MSAHRVSSLSRAPDHTAPPRAQAEELGVEIYTGYGAVELLYDEAGAVVGAATNDVGVAKDGSPKPSFERGMELRARATLLAEGCHGSLTKEAIARYNLREGKCEQTYGLGLKVRPPLRLTACRLCSFVGAGWRLLPSSVASLPPRLLPSL